MTKIAPQSKPLTKIDLEKDFSQLAIDSKTVILHSSLNSVGYVVGGPVTVIRALQSALGSKGTLATPGFTSNLGRPEDWLDENTPPEWMKIITDNLPAFEVDISPTFQIGIIPETFRKLNGTKRSNHPWSSWLASGQQANFITADVPYAFPNGDQSPLGRLYELNAYVIFLGTSYKTCSCLHLAEMRNKFAEQKRYKREFRILKNGKPEWEAFDDIYLYDQDFEDIGAAFEKEFNVQYTKVGDANVRLFRVQDLVDFAVSWMNANRSLG